MNLRLGWTILYIPLSKIAEKPGSVEILIEIMRVFRGSSFHCAALHSHLHKSSNVLD